MKEQILKKTGKTPVRINVTDQSAGDACGEPVSSSPRLSGMLSGICRLNGEEERFAWSAGIQQPDLPAPVGNNNQNCRIMSTMRIKCPDMKEAESIIADAQEILSHVEFGTLQNGVLTLFCVL